MGKSSVDYVVCIPSYQRAEICRDRTLAMLEENRIDPRVIYVYVANESEYATYKQTLKPGSYRKIVLGVKGLVPQRQFISDSWPMNKKIVYLDDDIRGVDRSQSEKFRGHSLSYFLKTAFQECLQRGAFIWGVYPVYNLGWMKKRPELSTGLKFIAGGFYGIINRPSFSSTGKDLALDLLAHLASKEDVERSLKFFLKDGIVLRFNRVGMVTKTYGNVGGLGNLAARLKENEKAAKLLKRVYPGLGSIYVRDNGTWEFKLADIPAFNHLSAT